uniref:Uncharacterized protein n=1 Tax=Panagrolaimus davidi TaxID=227884 RepID=A0A914PNB6_9BILA
MRIILKSYLPAFILLSLCFPVVSWEDSAIPVVFTDTASIPDTSNNNNETINEPLVYYVCGQERRTGDVICACRDTHLSCYSLSWTVQNPFKHANIQVANPNVTVEYVYLSDQQFGTLKKDELLPTYAKTIKSLRFSANAITNIENGTFNNFEQLRDLAFSGNSLKNLTAEVLTGTLGKTLIKFK